MNVLMVTGVIMALGGIFLTSILNNHSRFVSILGLCIFAIGIILGIKGRRKFDGK